MSPPPPDRRVSVIIPARAAAAAVQHAVRSALDQTDPAVDEVVVAAADAATARAAASVTDPRVRVIDNPEGSTPAGLNLALDATSGSFVVRCDAHAVLPPGYVQMALETLENPTVVNVGGRQVPRGEGTFERAVAMAMSSPLGSGDARYRIGGPPGPVDTVYLGVFRRSALEAVGGFDRTLERNQDYELNWRLREAGGLVWFDPRLEVEYRPRTTPSGLWRQFFEYGRWKRVVLRRHPGSLRLRQLASPALVAGLCLSAVLLATRHRSGLVVPAVYAAVTGGAGAYDLLKTGDVAATLEP
ncbi:MAG: glycosyltransferase family 2 protein, partial [Acidimicrobiia bacterium]